MNENGNNEPGQGEGTNGAQGGPDVNESGAGSGGSGAAGSAGEPSKNTAGGQQSGGTEGSGAAGQHDDSGSGTDQAYADLVAEVKALRQQLSDVYTQSNHQQDPELTLEQAADAYCTGEDSVTGRYLARYGLNKTENNKE